MDGTRAYFSTLGLLFGDPQTQVRIISGSEEGLSGWISTNILLQELFVNNQPLDTYGVIDMGGMYRIISSIEIVLCWYPYRCKYTTKFYCSKCY